MNENCDVLIIGGGLSGLQTASRLQTQGISFQLLEARERLGGRILSIRQPSDGSPITVESPSVDLGPSWFWPGQSQIAELVKSLELDDQVFLQHSLGECMIEYSQSRLERSASGASMAGAYRLKGGMQQLIDALGGSLLDGQVRCNSIVQAITHSSEGCQLSVLQHGERCSYSSQYIVIAAPPRVVVSTIDFHPALDTQHKELLNSVPTWMAAEAKFVAIYDEPFWRDDGLSGDGLSQIGPLVEIHDASPANGGPFALFGFVGVPASDRRGKIEALGAESVSQLSRLFGDKARSPRNTYLVDWATERYTCTSLDVQSRGGHATTVLDRHWPANRLIWAGTETADNGSQSNGYLEGAVQAANRAASRVIDLLLPHSL